MVMLFLRDPRLQQWGNKMTEHDKIDIIRVILQSNCNCPNCVELFKTVFSDQKIDEINSKVNKMKFLLDEGITSVDNCTNEQCKHIFD